jgi:hypothetical protein
VLKKRIDVSDPDAMYQMAMYLVHHSSGVEGGISEEFKLINQAVALGYPQGYYSVGSYRWVP